METTAVTILRGVSGCGKSHYANRLAGSKTKIVSADAFFTNRKGEYHFDRAKLGEAHNACLRDYTQALINACWERIVVDNTNCSITDIAPYVALAFAYGAHVSIVQIEEPLEVCIERNVHKVPAEAIYWQWNALKSAEAPWPAHWPNRLILKNMECVSEPGDLPRNPQGAAPV